MPASTGTTSFSRTVQVVGHLWQPEIMQEAPVALRAMIEGRTGRQTATHLLYDSHSRTAAALCCSVIPPERSAAWVEGLLSHVKAQHILFAASLPVGFLPIQHVSQPSMHAHSHTDKASSELPQGSRNTL